MISSAWRSNLFKTRKRLLDRCGFSMSPECGSSSRRGHCGPLCVSYKCWGVTECRTPQATTVAPSFLAFLSAEG